MKRFPVKMRKKRKDYEELTKNIFSVRNVNIRHDISADFDILVKKYKIKFRHNFHRKWPKIWIFGPTVMTAQFYGAHERPDNWSV